MAPQNKDIFLGFIFLLNHVVTQIITVDNWLFEEYMRLRAQMSHATFGNPFITRNQTFYFAFEGTIFICTNSNIINCFWSFELQWLKICFPFKMRRMIIKRPPRVDILFSNPWLPIRLFSRGFGKWLRIFVRTEIKLHDPPAVGCANEFWATEWNLEIDCIEWSNGVANTLKIHHLN